MHAHRPAVAITEATAVDPWMAAMRRGDFVTAWRVSDACLQSRLARKEPSHVGPRHLQSIWDGSSPAGKRVLVRCYHGLGDTIQFIRFVAPLRRLASEVIVWVQPALLPLIQAAEGVDRAIALHDGTPDACYDLDIEVMELAHVLRVDASSIRVPVPYLKHTKSFGRKPSDHLAIGVVWQAGDWAPHRGIDPTMLCPIARMSGVRLYSLQGGAAAKDARRIPAQPMNTEDVQRTAALLDNVHLLITVDTFIAHLAGALGVPVWTLLRSDCDWRWMQHGRDTVWYPTMRLFRQPYPGDWQSVIDEVMDALANVQRKVGAPTFGTNDWM
jgi:hypothetical protein